VDIVKIDPEEKTELKIGAARQVLILTLKVSPKILLNGKVNSLLSIRK
jgi:hypothetical protein